MITAEQKTELLARIARHEALDTIAQGAYADAGGNGLLRVCAVGCAMVEPADKTPSINNWHQAMEDMWGIPAWLGELEDRVFEGLPIEEAKTWPRRFVEAIPVDKELGQKLAHKLAALRLRETILPLAPTWPDDLREQVSSAVQGMVDALERGENLSAAESAAAEAAESAAAWSAKSAASATWAAKSAAEAAEVGGVVGGVGDVGGGVGGEVGGGVGDGAAAWSAESARIILTLTTA